MPPQRIDIEATALEVHESVPPMAPVTMRLVAPRPMRTTACLLIAPTIVARE